jgi:hypothetical protein
MSHQSGGDEYRESFGADMNALLPVEPPLPIIGSAERVSQLPRKPTAGERFSLFLGTFSHTLQVAYIIWYYARLDRQRKYLWKCYREGGGGILITPHYMTEDAALRWLKANAGGEVMYIDPAAHFIFYRSRP